jgi:hypothetical protein
MAGDVSRAVSGGGFAEAENSPRAGTGVRAEHGGGRAVYGGACRRAAMTYVHDHPDPMTEICLPEPPRRGGS